MPVSYGKSIVNKPLPVNKKQNKKMVIEREKEKTEFLIPKDKLKWILIPLIILTLIIPDIMFPIIMLGVVIVGFLVYMRS